MGLFSTKKTLVVSSTLYNLAGDEENRPNFLKSTVFSHMIGSDANEYLGQSISRNYLKGPGIAQRQFQSWAERNDFVGLPGISVERFKEIEPSDVAPYIPVPAVPAGQILQMQSANIVDGEFSIFAEQHILANHPTLFNTDWVCDYDEDAHTITIQYVDLSVEVISAGSYDPAAKYIVGYYYFNIPENEGSQTTIDSGTGVTDFSTMPALTDYEVVSTDSTGTETFSLDEVTTVTKTYSDSTPTTSSSSTTTSSSTESFILTEHERYDYYGSVDGESIETEATRYQYDIKDSHVIEVVTTTTVTTQDMGGGVIETTTTVVDTDTLVDSKDYEIQTSPVVFSDIIDGFKIFIYEVGSGTAALDNLVETVSVSDTPGYFPYIPVRIKGVPLNDQTHIDSGLYDECRLAYRKAFGVNKFSNLIEDIEANDDVDDIDFAYMSFGVTVSTKESTAKQYMYKFFKNLMSYQTTTEADLLSFQTRIVAFNDAMNIYRAWVSGQENGGGSAYFGTTRPSLPVLRLPAITTLKLTTDSELTNDSDNRISWYTVSEKTGVGLGKVDAEVGEYWFEEGSSLSWTYPKADDYIASNDNANPYSVLKVEKMELYHQVSETEYTVLNLYGFLHNNFVYGGKSVEISLRSAWDDEDDSGFLLPLHDQIIREMGLRDSTQLATANSYIVFNSYDVVKQKWYQSGFFKILVVIAIVVISIYTGGAGSFLGAGLLGTNVAVGTAVGLTGTAALVAGAAINALASIALSQIIKLGATELLGDEIGALVGAIVSFVVTAGFSGGIGEGFDLSGFASAKGILGLTSAIANGYNGFMEAEIAGIASKINQLTESYEEQLSFVEDMLQQLGGMNDLSFNPLQLTDVQTGNGSIEGRFLPESLDEFIHRTTLVGSDVADVTFSMVNDFADLSLQLPKN